MMAALEEHIIAKDTVLLHVEGDIFGRGDSSSSGSGPVPLVDCPAISVARLFLEKEKKAAFAAEWKEARAQKPAEPRALKFGWREDLEDGAELEEFVVVGGWEFSSDPIFLMEIPLFRNVADLVVRSDLQVYELLRPE